MLYDLSLLQQTVLTSLNNSTISDEVIKLTFEIKLLFLKKQSKLFIFKLIKQLFGEYLNEF